MLAAATQSQRIHKTKVRFKRVTNILYKVFVLACLLCLSVTKSYAVTIEFNNTGGTTSTNGLHFYIDGSTQIQVRRLNNTGQVYEPNTLPPSVSLDNGIFLRANGRVYGPDHNVATFATTGGMYNTSNISATTPPNPSATGDQQTATSNFGINLGPQVTVVWKHTTGLDFLTAEVTVVIPLLYAVSASNPVRYYHVFDTYLGGSDNGCGFTLVDTNGKRVVGTYPPASGTTCPSSTSIPNGVSIVESFRERSGVNFTNYCASGWNSFWVNGTTNCSVLQTANMSNNITTTFQDTGIGIQYNFTSAGTYTFSYDFVVGSPSVPPYDHLEIRHPGTANLCPTDVTVLACTSATVPCPAANLVNTGTLTGSIRYSPASPTITETPATFNLGGSGSTAVVSLLGSGARTYTLSGENLSTTPLNGTRCWNTATNTASCSYTVSNVPCVSGYECLETGLTYNNLTSNPASRNPLYTKLSGTGFNFDVVALESSGAQSTSYTATTGVTVELYDDSATPQPACSAYTSPIASQAITFAAGDAGRKALPSNFVLNNAYRKVRCRVKDTNVSVFGCSSDQFSVRPNNISVSSGSSASADNAGVNATATPVVKAGGNFTLTASTGVVGYDGAPNIDSTKVVGHAGAAQAGSVGGAFSVANASNGTATGSAFNYSEVGYFNFSANGVFDSTFTGVDSALGDCATGFVSAGGKQACSFGNSVATNYFGRFIPDHFAVATGSTTPACSLSATPSQRFTYLGQDGFSTSFTLKAENASNQITQNYIGNFAKFGLNTWANYVFKANGLPAGTTLAASAVAPTGTWVNGAGAVTAKHIVTRPSTPVAGGNISVSTTPVDSDGVTMPLTYVSSSSLFRYGRLLMPNTYGSELLPLTVPIEAQYWNGTAYQRNQLDNCTAIPTGAIAMGNYKSNLSACETALTGGGTLSTGKSVVKLSAPGGGNNGSVDLSLNLNSAAGTTCTPSSTAATSAAMPWFGNSPSARATFGLFKSPVIYMRESY